MKEFKIRCSSIGQIMTNSRSKTETLSETTKTYCETWLKEQIYERRKEFNSKYTQKGNEVEDNSIDFIADMLGMGMLFKNDKYFENEFLCGTPDMLPNDEVIDVKNSWDFSTFPLFETEVPNKNYFYQLQGYMALTGKTKAKLVYVLSDTPEHLIEKEAYWWCKNNGYSELEVDIYEDFKKRMTYPDVDNKHKIKVFNIDRDDAVIEAIQNRVIECRAYINELLTKIK